MADISKPSRVVNPGDPGHAKHHRDLATAVGDLADLVNAGGRLSGDELSAAFVHDDQRLRRWHLALASRANSPVNVMMMLDSFGEGTGATGIFKRFPAVLQERLRRQFQPEGIPGAALAYIPGWHLTPLAGFPVTTSGTVTGTTVGGLGNKCAQIAAGGSLTFTLSAATSARLMFLKGPGGAKFTVTVDGATGAVQDSYSATVLSGQTYEIPALGAGAHTITVSHDASSPGGRNVYVEGLYAYNGDESRGVRVIDGSRHGMQASELVANSGWINSFRVAGPYASVLLGFGHNEASNGVPAATYKENVTTVISRVRSSAQGNHSGSIVLVWWPKRLNSTAPGLWQAYRNALDEVAATDPNVYVLDLSRRIADEVAPWDAPANLGIWTSDNHLSDIGQGFSADVAASFLAPR